MKKFTFKKWVPEGRYRSFETGSTDIKLNKKIVGQIAERRLDYKWTISFAVKKEKTSNDPAGFTWKKMIIPFDSEPEARKFIQERTEEIIAKFDLYSFDD